MQTTLLGLAIAIILALVAALVAPLVIDWSHFRSPFEQEASRLAGIPVRVTGAIDARILPTPRIKLHDVEVGEAGKPPQIRASAVELELGLGPLLRGKISASELRVVAPQVALGIDAAGAIDWPAAPAPGFSPDALAVSRFTVEDGHVVLADAASGGRLILQKLWFNGDVRTVNGPFHGEGAFVVGDELYSYRISGGRSEDDGAFKLRIGIDPSNHPLTTEIDGAVNFDGGVPQFDGTLALARPVGATLARGERVMSDPWQLTGKLRLTPTAGSLQEMTLQYGPDERAVNLTGKADLKFGAHPRLDGAVTARQLDVDRALAAPDVTHRPPFVMVRSFFEAFVGAVRPPLPCAVTVGVDALIVGGTTIQSLRGDVRFDDKGWSLDDVTFRAPGFTDVKLSGHLDATGRGLAFSGPTKLASADLKALMAWLEGRGEAPAAANEPFTARGDITLASDRFTLDKLSATLDREIIEGRLAYSWAMGDRPATLDGELRAETLDVDALSAFATAALTDNALEMPRQVALVLDVGRATFAGVDARKVNARLKFDSGIVHIDRLSIADLGGAALDLSGSIEELSSQPRGRLTLDLDARTLAGLIDIAGRVAPQATGAFRPFAERLAPAKLHGVLTIERAPKAGTVAKLDLGGAVGALRLALNGEIAGDPAHPEAAALRLGSRFDADDGGALLALMGVDRIVAVDELPGQLTVSAGGPLDGVLRVKGLAAAGGFSAAVDGTLRLSGDQAPTGGLQVKASAADLRPLRRALTGQAGAAFPATAGVIVGLAGPNLTLTDLTVGIGKASAHGRLDIKLSRPLRIDGDVEADDIDAAAVAGFLLGLPSPAPGSGGVWSSEPDGPGAFAAANGAIAFKVARAALTPSLAARDVKGVLQLAPWEIDVNDLSGSLAGGRLGGQLTFHHDAEAFALRGRVELVGANAAALIGGGKSGVDGALTVKLRADGLGLNPDVLVGSLHGDGTIALSDGRFGGIDPAAFAAATRASDQSGSVEAGKIGATESGKIQAVVTAAMADGGFAVKQAESPITVTTGQVRLSNAQLKTPGGDALSLDGILDLNKAAIDARMTLSGQPAANALIPQRPELAITVKGPLASPERKLDVSALVGWLTLRANELQTRRLWSVEANRRDELLAAPIRPPSPAIRFLPKGTALETIDQASALAPPPGSRAFDRLRPDLPAAAPPKPAAQRAPAAPDKTSATTALPPATPPTPRAPLDLLFHSQN